MPDRSIFELSGKRALVTGGAGGIGRACAIGLAKAGADIAVVDLQDDMGRGVVDDIRTFGRDAFYIHCDVSDLAAVQSMVKQVVERFGRLDIALNNAGITAVGGTTIDDDALDVFHKTLSSDLHSVFYCCREEAKYMIPQRYGRIINTCSTAGSSVPNLPEWARGSTIAAYCAAKAAVRQLSRALAVEWVEYNITVNCISPGPVTTPGTQPVRDIPELLQHENETIPMHRQGEPDEMVGGVIYFASDASTFTTGQDLIMDGGYTVW